MKKTLYLFVLLFIAFLNQSFAQNNDSTENVNNSLNSEDNSYSNGIEYRLQIGITIIPASKRQLKELNPTDFEVKTYKDGKYYKHTVGSFKTIQEAKNCKNAYGISGAFVVKYKDGTEVK